VKWIDGSNQGLLDLCSVNSAFLGFIQRQLENDYFVGNSVPFFHPQQEAGKALFR
jgi:hypothetical protein